MFDRSRRANSTVSAELNFHEARLYMMRAQILGRDANWGAAANNFHMAIELFTVVVGQV